MTKLEKILTDMKDWQIIVLMIFFGWFLTVTGVVIGGWLVEGKWPL